MPTTNCNESVKGPVSGGGAHTEGLPWIQGHRKHDHTKLTVTYWSRSENKPNERNIETKSFRRILHNLSSSLPSSLVALREVQIRYCSLLFCTHTHAQIPMHWWTVTSKSHQNAPKCHSTGLRMPNAAKCQHSNVQIQCRLTVPMHQH